MQMQIQEQIQEQMQEQMQESPPPYDGGGSGWGRKTLAALLLISAAAASADDARVVSQSEVLKRIESKDAATLIVDVRTPEEYAAGHVPGALNIPYTHLPARASALAGAGDKDIVLYCQTGVRADRAAERLREHGFTRLLHLQGDMKQWVEKKLQIEVTGD